MPNYRYNAPEYGRRNNCGRTAPVMREEGCRTKVQPKMQPACCDYRAAYDELSGMPIAMAYVPWQQWRALYEVEKGLHCGTIFEELNKPFRGIGGCSR